jgi:general secretion pathway protein A
MLPSWLRQRVIATHHLEPMDANEVEPYIVHRLTRAGWNGRPQITADAYSALYAETGGVPRKLNTLMNRVMLMGAVEQVDVLDGALVEAVIADMAGKPFEYDAQMSASAQLVQDVPAAAVVVANEPVKAEAVTENAEEPVPEVAVPLAAVAQQLPPPVVVPEPAVTPNADLEALTARVASLEQRVSEQEAALRRVLAMMIDWMDKEGSFEARFVQNSRAA